VAIPPPYALLAELTHHCPLHCAYCANPIELARRDRELSTADWRRVLREAAALGVVQVGFSGGEPLARPDLEELVGAARRRGLYTNLITSGLGLTANRAAALAASGLNSVQLSVQAADAEIADRLAGRRAHLQKAAAARLLRDAGLPLSMNVVLHRRNIDRLDRVIDLCCEWGAERLELANAQYYGWALLNRRELLPSHGQVKRAERVFESRRAALRGRMEVIWVIPDYYERLPKPCMGGWGAIALTVAPDGRALPCPTAGTIRTLRFDSVRGRDLGWIWRESAAFNAYRGREWMTEPCRSCPRREMDFGGCRCQAFALTGEAARTDPVCHWSPDRHLVDQAVREANGAGEEAPGRLRYRRQAALRQRATG
jgi:pyrroloquinoline quinone biosynthesis protein E